MSVDSGTSFMYTASTLVTNTSITENPPTLFNPNASTTYHDENGPADACNCGGDPNFCVMGVDNVSVAGTGLVAEGMAFGVASKLGSNTFNSGQAGTIGMGRQPGDISSES